MILIAPFWPQKEWFATLLSLLLDVPFELPMPWNFLVQPCTGKFHRGLESLRACAWKLSSNLSERLAFLSWLQTLLHQNLGDPQHISVREGGPDFFIGVLEEILLHARLFSSS